MAGVLSGEIRGKISNPNTSIEERLKLVTKIRESLEVVHLTEYEVFLKEYLPVFLSLLKATPPQSTDNAEHRLRNVVLEVLLRLPQTEHLRQYLRDLLQSLLNALERDNEENAIICLRALFDLHKNFRGSQSHKLLEEEALPFVAFVTKVYHGFKFTATTLLDERRARAVQDAALRKATELKAAAMQQGQAQGAEKTAAGVSGEAAVVAEVTKGGPNDTAMADATGSEKTPLVAPPPPAAKPPSTVVEPVVPPAGTLKPLTPAAGRAAAAAAAASGGGAAPLAVPRGAGDALAGSAPSMSGSGLDVGGSQPSGATGVPLTRSTCSFKVVTECPLTVMFLFQLYPRLVKDNVPKLLGPMVAAIGIPGPYPVPPILQQAHSDMKAAQIKTVSFLTYLLRTFSSELRQHRPAITRSIVDLLRFCPDNVPVRKELLVAMRHVISDNHQLLADFRQGFNAHISVLMKEEVLVGTDGACYEVLRPLAYSLLAELVHHVRMELNITQLGQVIYIFSRNLHDRSLPTSMQTTSARLMLNLVHCMKISSANKLGSRELHLRVLDTYLSKLSTMRKQMKRVALQLKLQNDKGHSGGNQKTAAAQPASKGKGASGQPAATTTATAATEEQKGAAAKSTTDANKSADGATGSVQPAVVDDAEKVTEADGGKKDDEGDGKEGPAKGEEEAVPNDTKSGTKPSTKPGTKGTSDAAGTSTPTPVDDGPKEGEKGDVPMQDAEAAPTTAAGTEGSAGVDGKAAESAQGADAAKKDETSESKEKEKVQSAAAQAAPRQQERAHSRSKASSIRGDSSVDPYKELSDCKQLLKTLLVGLKSVVEELATPVNRPVGAHDPSGSAGSPAVPLPPHEMRIVSGIIPYGVECLLHVADNECGELVELLVDIFNALPQANMYEAFSSRVPALISTMQKKPILIQLPVLLISNQNTLPYFGEVLVNFLMAHHLQDLKEHTTSNATIVLRLFHVLFSAIAKMPENEKILRMHVAPLVEFCLSAFEEFDKAAGYVQLLRSLFRSLAIQKRDAAKRSEPLYREFNRVLQPCIATLLSLLHGPDSHGFRPHIVELLLTLPADLSSLLPDLSRLMPPLVMALKAQQQDLVQHGLRTLEVWVDSLNPEFLEPAMAPVEGELMLALWSHLRPHPPYAFGIKALQLLGKLGGRSRRFFREPLQLECKENPEHGLRLILTFQPQTSFLVPLDRCINLARARVASSSGDIHYRRQALTFLQVCVSSVLNLRGVPLKQELISQPTMQPIDIAALAAAAGSVPGTSSTPHGGGNAPRAEQIRASLLSESPVRRTSASKDPKELHGSKTKMQLMAERAIFKSLLTSVMAASADDELQALDAEGDERKTSTREFVLSVCRHFALFYSVPWQSSDTDSAPNPPPTSEAVPAPAAAPAAAAAASNENTAKISIASLRELEPTVFLDALTDSLSSPSVAVTAIALQGLKVLLDTAFMVSNARAEAKLESEAGISGLMHELLPRLLHCTYDRTWSAMRGGVAGLRLTVKTVPSNMLQTWQPRILRAYLGVIRHLPGSVGGEGSDVISGIKELLRQVPPSSSEVTPEEVQTGTISLLATELFASGSNPSIRQQVEACLELYAEQKGKKVVDLLNLVHEKFLKNLLQRQLRMKPLEAQVETISAVSYCLSLQPSLVTMNNEVLTLIADALNFANQEREMSSKLISPRHAANVGRLHRACLELLCAAMGWDDFYSSAHGELRNRITSTFFQCLSSSSKDIVAIAKEGLRTVVSKRSLPKELLQASLRPVLVNLAHHRQLTLPLLHGLARLLELLSTWFNATLGQKLLEHLRKWLEPDKLAREAKSWRPGEDIRIAAAVLDLFHLLPNAANKFLDTLVELTFSLESVLPPHEGRGASSPYLTPLLKYLLRYPDAAATYFLDRIEQVPYFYRFVDILRRPESGVLRAELSKCSQRLIDKLSSSPAPPSDTVNPKAMSLNNKGALASKTAYIRTLRLIRVICKVDPGWLSENEPVVRALISCWKSPMRLERLAAEARLDLDEAKESKWLAKCLMAYVSAHHDKFDILIMLLDIFNARTRIDFTFVKDYMRDEVSTTWSIAERQHIIKHFLDLFEKRVEKKIQQPLLVAIIQHLVLPILLEALSRGEGVHVVDADSVAIIVSKLLDPGETITATYSESLRVELLQLATLLIRYMPQQLVSYRRQLIKFGWNHLKREDTTSKLWAFVNVCHFLDKYQAPDKIILQVFVALLRTSQADTRHLVRQALSIITPALPSRLTQGEHRYPTWIRYTKKMLIEEGHSTPNLVHIFQLIVRHADLFYPSRAQFLPHMVNSLAKLGLPTSPIENRKLAVDLAGLVIHWEQQYYKNKRKQQLAAAATAAQQQQQQQQPAANPNGAAVGEKRERDESAVPVQAAPTPSKVVKLEADTTVKDAATAAAVGAESKAAPQAGANPPPRAKAETTSGDDFAPTPQMQSIVLNFLVKMAFVTAAETKDRELQQLKAQTFSLVSVAMKMWNTVPLKLDYMERLFPSAANMGVGGQRGQGGTLQHEKSLSPILWTAMALVHRALDVQGTFFVQTNAIHISQLIEPTLTSGNEQTSIMLSKIIAKTFEVAPQALEPDSMIAVLITRAEQMLLKMLESILANKPVLMHSSNDAAAGGQASAKSALKPGHALSFVLDTIRGLRDMPRYADRYDHLMTLAVKCYHRLVKELDQSNKTAAGGGRGQGASGSSGGSGGRSNDPGAKLEFGGTLYNIAAAFSLVNARVMAVPENRRLVMHAIGNVLQERNAPVRVLITILHLVLRWIEGPMNNQKEMKEVVVLMKGLVTLHLNSNGSLGSEWERTMLKLLLTLCSPSYGSANVSPPLRREMFEKVERQFLVGLRARHPAVRRAFFKLHHDAIGGTLFDRLEYIVQHQDWESLSDTFWLKQALDFLLAILVEQEPVTLAPNSAQIPAFLSLVDAPASAAAAEAGAANESGINTDKTAANQAKQEVTPPAAGAADPTATKGKEKEKEKEKAATTTRMALMKFSTMDELIDTHAGFLAAESTLRVSSLMKPLRELAHADPHVAYHMWVLVFPIVWATLPKDGQVALAKPLITLLSREYHQRQQTMRPNVVQALLEGISLSQPQPKIPSELIRYLGQTFNAWRIAIPMLESHVSLFPNENRCFDALADLYKHLNEDDMHAGLWRRRCTAMDTRVALALAQHGLWSEAQDILFRVIEKTSGATKSVQKSELCLWEELWLNSSKQLGQWNVLAEFGKTIEHPDLLMDSLWRLPDWQALKDVLPKAQVDDGPRQCIVRAYSALNEGSLQEADMRIHRGIQTAVQRWWQLPEQSLREREPLLQTFQCLVEAQETARILLELRSAQQSNTPQAFGFSNLKETLETWRLRTPNTWDSMTAWMDVALWRCQVYNIVIQAFKAYEQVNPTLHQMGYLGKAWTVNKLAQIARKQGHCDVSLQVLNKIYGYNTMELQEAFVKICEQAQTYLAMRTNAEKVNGLNLINTTNLEYFPQHHKAEIFRLKGELLWALGDTEAANNALSTAISLHPLLSEGWLSWGSFCDDYYTRTGDVHWLEYTIACYLNTAVQSGNAARHAIARVLQYISFAPDKELVARVMSKYEAKLPVWIWLPWIPQLLNSLPRPEYKLAMPILIRVASTYPQAVYYLLRTYLLERRLDYNNYLQQQQQQQQQQGKQGSNVAADSSALRTGGAAADATKTTGSPAGAGGLPIPAAAGGSGGAGVEGEGGGGGGGVAAEGGAGAPMSKSFEVAKEVMEKLRMKHPHLAAEIEVFLTELGTRFMSSPEERLLAVVYALMHRCYKCPAVTTAEVPAVLRKELSSVCRACFSSETVTKHPDFVALYKKDFDESFNPEVSTCFPSQLKELIESLKGWKARLLDAVEGRMNRTLRLEDESPALLDLVFLEVEVPGQYVEERDAPPEPEKIMKLERVGGDIDIVRRHGNSYRRIKLLGTDGKANYFLVHASLPPTARGEERMQQLFRVTNRLFGEYRDSKRRHLAHQCPVIVPVWPQGRLVSEAYTTATFGEAYEINCARYGRDADLPIMVFKEKMNAAVGQPEERVQAMRLEAYNHINSSIVNENVFSQYMYKTLPSCNHLWAFKKHFASQLALSSLMSFIMKVGHRAPTKMLFVKSTGSIVQSDFYPSFDARGVIESHEPVPFRLTRNLSTFLTPFGVEGMFVACMSAGARALVQPRTSLDSYLALYFRDELIAWANRPRSSGPMTFASLPEDQLKAQVKANVQEVQRRIQRVVYGNVYGDTAAGASQGQLKDIHQPVNELVEQASNANNLSKMDPMWHPWF